MNRQAPSPPSFNSRVDRGFGHRDAFDVKAAASHTLDYTSAETRPYGIRLAIVNDGLVSLVCGAVDAIRQYRHELRQRTNERPRRHDIARFAGPVVAMPEISASLSPASMPELVRLSPVAATDYMLARHGSVEYWGSPQSAAANAPTGAYPTVVLPAPEHAPVRPAGELVDAGQH